MIRDLSWPLRTSPSINSFSFLFKVESRGNVFATGFKCADLKKTELKSPSHHTNACRGKSLESLVSFCE